MMNVFGVNDFIFRVSLFFFEKRNFGYLVEMPYYYN